MVKVIVVTGGGRGIGAATAKLAAKSGYSVCISYVKNADAAFGVVRQIREAGGRASAFAADVSQEADVLGLFEAVDREFGPVNALVNNAGVLDVHSRVDQMSAARVERTLTVNVIGSFLSAREAIRRMSRKHGEEGGDIVSLSSTASRIGATNEYVDYAAAKGAIDAFTI